MMKFLAAIALASCLQLLDAQITSSGCGTTKNCYQYPEGCQPSSPTCKFISWRPAGEKSKYIFELSGETGNGTRYISFALALLSDMKDADMYYCDGKTFGVGSIPARHATPTFLDIGDGIEGLTAATVDGVGQCTFSRPAIVNRIISKGADHDFDIEKHRYFLLAASGNVVDGTMVKHNWRVHLAQSYDFSGIPSSARQGTLLSMSALVGCVFFSIYALL